MKIKIQGGVATDHNTNLCSTCKWASIREHDDGAQTILCYQFGKKEVKRKVVRCNEYKDHNHVDLYDMKQMAWIITPGREHLGFRQQSKLSSEEKQSLEELTFE